MKHHRIKTAILFSGMAYNFNFAIESLMKNLVEENDADVFIFISRKNSRRKAPHTLPIFINDEPAWTAKVATQVQDDSVAISLKDCDLIRNVFKDKLKEFKFIEDDPAYLEHLERQRLRMMNVVNDYRKENSKLSLPLPFGNDITSPDNGNIKSLLDQYHHVKRCFELMEGFEKANGFKYDRVARVRLDFIAPFPFVFDWPSKKDHSIYSCGNIRQDVWERCDEYCFFSHRCEAGILFPNLDRMGFIVGNRDRTVCIPRNNDFVFAAECQFSLLLRELELSVNGTGVQCNAHYTDGGDGWDYMNYIFRRDGDGKQPW